MKKLTILLFSILISFNSYGEWTEVFKDIEGNTYYIDKNKIKEHGGYVYWWEFKDYIKHSYGYMSHKAYKQGDCGVSRVKYLSFLFYKQPMAKGSYERDNSPSEWNYPPPGNSGETALNYVCNYVK
jgi:hypothetical protein